MSARQVNLCLPNPEKADGHNGEGEATSAAARSSGTCRAQKSPEGPPLTLTSRASSGDGNQQPQANYTAPARLRHLCSRPGQTGLPAGKPLSPAAGHEASIPTELWLGLRPFSGIRRQQSPLVHGQVGILRPRDLRLASAIEWEGAGSLPLFPPPHPRLLLGPRAF